MRESPKSKTISEIKETSELSLFQQLYALTEKAHIETLQMRGGIDYIEWSEGFKIIKEFDSSATFEVIRDPNGMPFWDSKYGPWVRVRVTVKGVSIEEDYPVEGKISEITSQDIADATQRAYMKALGRMGFGLQLWIKHERDALKKGRAQTGTTKDFATEAKARILEDSAQKKAATDKPPVKSGGKITDKQASRFFAIAFKDLKMSGEDIQNFLVKEIGATHPSQIEWPQYEAIIEKMKKQFDKGETVQASPHGDLLDDIPF